MRRAYWEGYRACNRYRLEKDQVGDGGTYLAELRAFAGETCDREWKRDLEVTGRTDRMVEEASKHLGGAIREYSQIIKAYEDAYGEQGNVQKKARLVGRPIVGSFIYYVAGLLILLGEVPLNLVVFRLFGEAEIANLGVALALGLIILLVAHLVGKKFKHVTRTLESWVLIVCAMVLILGLLAAIGFMRHHYLVRVEGEAPSTEVMYAFISLQFLIFWGVLLLAYGHHFPADRGKLERWWKRWMDGKVSQEKDPKRFHWKVQGLANSIDRLRDVYVGAYLACCGNIDHKECPLVFYLIDFDDLIRSDFERRQQDLQRCQQGVP